jgi:hypothetical protein
MKYNTAMKIKLIYTTLLIHVAGALATAQTGINTTTPRGALDLNTTTMGIVYPTVSLTDVTVEALTNPNGPNIIAGTTVYNTNTTINGANSVYPGLYYWNGSQWVPQFEKKDNKLFVQAAGINPESDLGAQTITFNANSFTPKYSGAYKVIITTHVGGGTLDVPNTTSSYVNFAAVQGTFNFTFNGSHSFLTGSYSGYNNDKFFKGGSLSPPKVGTNSINQTTYVLEKTLTGGTSYPLSLTFDQATAPGFVDDGNLGNGLGYITIPNAIKCTVEVIYVGN